LIAKVNYFLVGFVENFYVLQAKYCFNTVMPSQDSSEKLFEGLLHFFLPKNSDQRKLVFGLRKKQTRRENLQRIA
jgi:hypothetical protein